MIYVRDLEGIEYPLQSTSTNENEVNGSQSISAEISSNKVNSLFIDHISEMWVVVDHDNVEHKVIYAKRKGEGDDLKVEIKGIPLFFDIMDNQRVERRVDEHMTAEVFFNFVFNEPDYQGNKSGYGFVLNGEFSAVQWEGLGEGETRLESFKRGLERYKCEFRIVGRTVYLENQIGRDTQFQYRHRLNASNIVQEIDANEMWTYAKGYGDYGDGEGGEDWQNAKLIREYTSPLSDILGIRHAPPIKNGNITTTSQMDNQLKTLVDESLKISVSAEVYDLQEQGYPIAQSQIGDRVFLIDERIGLDDEVRVVSQSITRNWKGDIIDLNITFGSEGITKRHQSNIQTAVKDITEVMGGRKQIPYSVHSDAVKEVTETIKGNQDSIFKYMSNGVIGWNGDDPNYMTRYVGDAIGFSDDGGATFGTAMSAKDGIVADYIRTGSMLADRIAGGILSSLNGNTVFNMNSGELKMENANFEFESSAKINFNSRGNKIQYHQSKGDISRYSGLGVGLSASDEYPITYLGTSEDTPYLEALDDSFRGIITRTKKELENGSNHLLYGEGFQLSKSSGDTTTRFVFDFRSDYPSLYGANSSENNYRIGTPEEKLGEVHASKVFAGTSGFVTSTSTSTRLCVSNDTWLFINQNGTVGISHNGKTTVIGSSE